MRTHYNNLTTALQSAPPDSVEQQQLLQQIQDIEHYNEARSIVDLTSRENMKRFLHTREFFKHACLDTCSEDELRSFCLMELAEIHYHSVAVAAWHSEEHEIGNL